VTGLAPSVAQLPNRPKKEWASAYSSHNVQYWGGSVLITVAYADNVNIARCDVHDVGLVAESQKLLDRGGVQPLVS
jgi:hypothetical protein